MESVYSESDNSENIIPSSDLEPPPPVNYILSKSRNGCVLAEESSNQEFGNVSSSISRAVTQQDDFEDIRCSSLNEAAAETSLDSLSRDISLHTLQVPSGADSPTNCQKSVSSPIRSTLSSEVLENIEKVNPKRMDQMDKILSTTLGVWASLPIAPPKHAQRSSATRFRSLANMEPNFCSTDSLISTPIGATTTNTTSDRTTRSGSDLFRSDSSGFSKPLVLPGNCRNTVSTSTATDDQEASPAFSYTLSLSVLRHSSKVEKTDLVEFKIPDFTKTVTWQSRIRRVDEDAAAAVSEAAKVLADSLGDWLRELFTSDSEGPQCDYNRTPATVIAQQQSIFDARVSSSSSEYFLPLKMNALAKRPETNGQGPPKNVTDGTIDREQRGILLPSPTLPYSLCKSVFNSFDYISDRTSDREPPVNTIGRTEPKPLGRNSDLNNTLSDLGSQSGETPHPVSSAVIAKRKKPTRTSTSVSTNKSGVNKGVLVYAKWYSNKFFYAGQIAETSAEDKFRILFDDNSQKNVTGKNIILAELLPIGANVYADISGKSEYEVGYLVSGHVIGTTPPSYIVKRIEDNEVFQLERRRVAIVLESMIHLLAAGQISTVGSRSDISSVTSGTSSFISPTSSSSSPSKYAPRVVLLKVVTPNAPVGSSVRRKRVLTEVGRIAERAVPAKRLMRRKTAPQQKRRSPPVSTPSLASRSLGSAKQRRTRSGAEVSAQRQEFKRKHSGFSRRESQIWVVGRRVVARASRTSMRFSSTSRSSSRSRRCPRTKPSGKRRKFSSPLDNTITPSLPTLTVEASIEHQETPPPVVPVLPPLLSESAISLKDQSMRTAESEEFRRMCQRHRIPLPHPDLFSQWCVVRTKGVNSTDLKSIRIASSSPHARKQFSVCENANFLRLLITAGGGQNMELLDADCVSSTGRLVTPEEEGVVSKAKRPHIVLIASSAKRTVKFLQGLATLGRVPLVHPVWLLDACFLAGGRVPLVADSEVVSKIVTLATEPANIPFELLRRSARTLYELPRGVDRITNQTVLPYNVPAWFIEPLDVFGPKTLLALGGYTSSRIIAIVTDDFPGFGKGWFSILRHAMYTESGAPATDGMPKIITPAESVEQLNRLKTMEDAPTCKSNIVLVDQERIPKDGVSQIESMGFTVINKEFLIQSLIHGKMLDLKYGTTWKE